MQVLMDTIMSVKLINSLLSAFILYGFPHLKHLSLSTDYRLSNVYAFSYVLFMLLQDIHTYIV